MRSLLSSFVLVPKAIAFLIARPRFWKYVIIPFFLNSILTVILIFSLFYFIQSSIVDWLQNYQLFLDFVVLLNIVKILVFLISMLISIIAMLYIGMFITIPFNNLLVSNILSEAGVIMPSDIPLVKDLWFSTFRSIKYELVKLVLTIFSLVFSLIFSVFVPVVGLFIATAWNVLFAGYINLLDYNDLVLEKFSYNNKKKFKYLHKNLKSTIGFLITTGFVLYIPFVNYLYLPIAYTVATLEYIKLNKGV